MNWIWIKRDRIHAAVTTGLCNLYFTTRFAEFSFENFTDQLFKILPVHCSKIETCIKLAFDIARRNEPLVFSVEL